MLHIRGRKISFTQAAKAGAEAVANAAAATVQASVETGSATAKIAAGTAAGGPWGAVLSAAWAMRHTLFKILVCLCLVLTVQIILFISLPSIVSDAVFQAEPGSEADLMGQANDMGDLVAACIQGGYDQSLGKVERIIEENGYDYEASMKALINHGSATPDYDVAYVFAAYSASMGQRATNGADMRGKLDSVAGDMFPVTYEEKEFERIIPVTYPLYKPVNLTVVTGKEKIGEVNGEPRYSYTLEERTLYTPNGEAETQVRLERTAYAETTVEVPVYSQGTVVGTKNETYFAPKGTEVLEPETEIVPYAEATIHPFDSSVILQAFGVNASDPYDQFPGVTYGEAIQYMAQALKLTLYGKQGIGEIPSLTDAELMAVVNGMQTTSARKKLIETALTLVGKVPYFWGGKSAAGWNSDWNTPKTVTASGSVSSGSTRPYGLDCSGFTDWVYKTAFGQSIGTSSASQWSKSTEISEADLQPGDLGFKARPGDGGINHVLMYVGLDENGNRRWVHCSSSAGGVVLNTVNYVKYFRRPNGVDYDMPVATGGIAGLGEPLYTMRVHITHYCACAKCCGKNADGITASGKPVAEGMVAMSSHYPFGTQLVINGTLYTVEDRGGSGIENDISRVDIFVPDHQEALRLGRFWAEATFYRLGR